MDTILQGVMELGGVGAAFVLDAGGWVLAHRGAGRHERPPEAAVTGAVLKAVDAVQLQQEDWEWITAQYADGRLLLRNLGVRAGRAHVLAVVADARLNTSFATVAIRVAGAKLIQILEGGGVPAPSASRVGPAVPPATAAASSSPGTDSRPALASSGLSWSKISTVGLSRVPVADPASAAFLGRCAKELARHVGPIAKVYVEEAARRVSPEAPFGLASAAALIDDLAAQIEDDADRTRFRYRIEQGERR